VTVPDDSFPHGGAKVCYYACTLDEHGNSSPLVRLGCTLAFENSEPPRPQLSAITALDPVNAPQMLLTWFCPGVNLDRFEVGIAALGGSISSNCSRGFLQMISDPVVPDLEPVSPEFSEAQGLPPLLPLEFQRFITPRPGGNFGDENKFVVPVDIELGRRYIVYVKSIARSGARSPRSNLESFVWQEHQPPQPEVPWPARSIPPVGNSFSFDFGASWMQLCGGTNAPVGPVVRISLKGQTTRVDSCPQTSVNAGDPNFLLPTNNLGESIFPVVLYRQQVANGDFPIVSGDLVQVSPMMESIAWGMDGNQVVILDPYVLFQRTTSLNEGPMGIFLRDTQPIISGARYRYYLQRFNKLGELAETIPVVNELEVP
jgi:hypothetical protein